MPYDAATFFPQYTAMVFRLMHRRGEGTDWLRSLIFHLDSEISKLPPKKAVPAFRDCAGIAHISRFCEGGEEVMDQKQVKEILGKQLQLLAEVSKKTSKPEDLPELTKAMVLLAQNL